jgi:hypothetical protein
MLPLEMRHSFEAQITGSQSGSVAGVMHLPVPASHWAQTPPHWLSQQTPSTQNPLVQSRAALH